MKVYHILTHSVDSYLHPELQKKPENFGQYNGHPNRLVKRLICQDKKKEWEQVMVNLSTTVNCSPYETTHIDGYPVVVLKTSVSVRDPLEFSLPLIRWIQKADGIIHVHGISSFVYDSIAPFLTSKPSIAHVRGGQFTWRAFPVAFPKYCLLAPLTLRMPKKLFVQNRSRMEKYQKYYAIPREKMVHVPNGVDLEKFRQDKKRINQWEQRLQGRNEIRILFVGRVERSKGILDLVEATGRLRQRYKIKLIIVGTGNLDNELRSRKDPNLVLLGRINDIQDVAAWYHWSDIFALPSYSEGFPNAVMEAMACGKAVVTTPTDGALDLVDDGKTGLLTPIGNTQQLAEKLEMLIKDGSLRKELGKNARKKIEREFTWDKIVPRIFREYRSL